MRRRQQEEVSPEVEAGKAYTPSQLSAIADAILKQDARSELCRACGARGEETGRAERITQDITDGSGNQLVLEFKELGCARGHTWYEGEGSARGIGGDNPILFEEHFISRRRREIYTSVGTPDPEIVSGIYNRSHPNGRKVNSPEQRKKNGAAWYR